jgi:polyisoprenoid-binding protein YceI
MQPGTQTLGPDNARLLVRTGRTGGAAKAGHDLLLEVTSWSATVDPGADPSDTALTLTADASSMRVLEGTGGVMPLGDKEKNSILKAIDADVLKRTSIEFRSTNVSAGAEGHLDVDGELELFGRRAPVSFVLATGGGRLTGTATIKQTDWGIKPYTTLFGALKVADEVTVEIDGSIPSTGS